MRLPILLVASACFLSACDLFSQCDPTPDQHDWCEWHNDWGWFAMGEPGTNGVCRDTEFLCSNGETTRSPLTAAGGSYGEGVGGGFGGGGPDVGFGGPDGGLDAACTPPVDGGIEPDGGPPACIEPDMGVGL